MTNHRQNFAAAEQLAMAELPMWPAGSRLHYSPELSTPDVIVFRVFSHAGRDCGTVAVTETLGVITRKAPTTAAPSH